MGSLVQTNLGHHPAALSKWGSLTRNKKDVTVNCWRETSPNFNITISRARILFQFGWNGYTDPEYSLSDIYDCGVLMGRARNDSEEGELVTPWKGFLYFIAYTQYVACRNIDKSLCHGRNHSLQSKDEIERFKLPASLKSSYREFREEISSSPWNTNKQPHSSLWRSFCYKEVRICLRERHRRYI